jgi:outer membrane protein assembly factor BamE (lipoprotein component of BamABCDE complex)
MQGQPRLTNCLTTAMNAQDMRGAIGSVNTLSGLKDKDIVMMMPSRRIAAVCTASLMLTMGACARIKDVKGYIADYPLIETLQPGVDNKSSVQKILGRPTMISAVDPNRWYYVSQLTQQLAFLRPKPTLHQALAVSFDAKGNMVKAEKLGLDQIVTVDASSDKTPTRGKDTSFWDNLFGDIGRYSPGGGDGGGGGPQ